MSLCSTHARRVITEQVGASPDPEPSGLLGHFGSSKLKIWATQKFIFLRSIFLSEKIEKKCRMQKSSFWTSLGLHILCDQVWGFGLHFWDFSWMVHLLDFSSRNQSWIRYGVDTRPNNFPQAKTSAHSVFWVLRRSPIKSEFRVFRLQTLTSKLKIWASWKFIFHGSIFPVKKIQKQSYMQKSSFWTSLVLHLVCHQVWGL